MKHVKLFEEYSEPKEQYATSVLNTDSGNFVYDEKFSSKEIAIAKADELAAKYVSDKYEIEVWSMVNGDVDTLIYSADKPEPINSFVITDGEYELEIEKDYDGSRWVEVPNDNSPERWGNKTYMSYLSPEDVLNWIRKDYEGDWRIV